LKSGSLDLATRRRHSDNYPGSQSVAGSGRLRRRASVGYRGSTVPRSPSCAVLFGASISPRCRASIAY
jgi:hypothetical protein